ncbi:nucleotide-sugar transporter [Basidiobolus meristosporus CBS 931.73]|uniref:Nucleotide-sugar transporter n=1 Tax=Basidiobolus meristosporus CBS 931.73 TaxID=1314790 RepID=A0A1Y1XTM5_9FUNG|nr:nucleotide-sugar transporter [Basidiobolus meristosporus CBS 931.73]|eukprot:ORX89127.1 nucleotide-sugar transporter [Basidiobolus meristosporus CBS 931.73]
MIPMKYLSLIILVIQNSALVLVMTQSRDTTPHYATSTAVTLSELTKLIICLVMHARDELNTKGHVNYREVMSEIFGRDAWKLMIPAGLYTLQNNLQYVAVTLLDAATFQVTYQLKILTTALCTVIILRRSLSMKKWLALVLLTIGVVLVQFPTKTSESTEDKSNQRLLGLITVVCACMISGLAGVYFEKILKGTRASIWVRNIQLSFFSLFPAVFLGVLWMDGDSVINNGFWYGYNIYTVMAIACQACGGIIVAIVVKYADNILKGFATSISIIVSSIFSIYLFDFHITLLFVFGSSLVIYSSYMYGLDDSKKPAAYQPVDTQMENMENTANDDFTLKIEENRPSA